MFSVKISCRENREILCGIVLETVAQNTVFGCMHYAKKSGTAGKTDFSPLF